jgi:hypothetical protein
MNELTHLIIMYTAWCQSGKQINSGKW